MKFTHVKVTKHTLEVRNPEEPSTQVGDHWYHRTRPAEVADIVALLRGDSAARNAVLEGLEGTDPRLPRANPQVIQQQDIPPGWWMAGQNCATPNKEPTR